MRCTEALASALDSVAPPSWQPAHGTLELVPRRSDAPRFELSCSSSEGLCKTFVDFSRVLNGF